MRLAVGVRHAYRLVLLDDDSEPGRAMESARTIHSVGGRETVPVSGDMRYAVTPTGQEVAFRVVDGGPGRAILYVPGFLYSIESVFDDPPYSRFIAGLAESSPVVLVDRRGVGASDPVDFDGDVWQQWSEDLIAVADALSLDQFAIVGYGPSADLAFEAAARVPDRVDAVVAVNPTQAASADVLRNWLDLAAGVVQRDRGTSDRAFDEVVPSRSNEPGFLDWNLRAGRLGASPRTAAQFWQAVLTPRPHDHLRNSSARALVLFRRDVVERWGGPAITKDYVKVLADATVAILDGGDVVVNAGDVSGLAFEIASFLHGGRAAAPASRPLQVVLFTDIVASTEAARSAGDLDWRKVLDHHDRMIDRILARHGGRMVKATGDGALAVFDSPSSATSSAQALQRELAALGIEVRMGLHVGEVEVRRSDIAGIAVHLAARVMGEAGAGQILTSAAVPLASMGSTHRFRSAGVFDLKGFDDAFELFEVVD